MLNRRQFSLSLLGAGALTLLGGSASAKAADNHSLIASASEDAKGQHWLHVINENGEALQSFALPERAHQVIFHPHQPWVVVTARRPGYYLWVADYLSGDMVYQISPQQGYHFYGHAEFSADGDFLYTTENQLASGQGRIVVRALKQQGKVINEYPSYGIGPHQLALMPDQQTLVIANGGILTGTDRGKLNLATMDPSLAYVDAGSGELLEQVRFDEDYHQLSIRHLDVNQAGKVVTALQYQGALFDEVPLVAAHERGSELKPLWAPLPVNQAMKQYAGSACFDRSGRYAMVSCPRGDMVTLWDLQTERFVDKVQCRDGCGLASAKPGEFLISNGLGKMYRYDMLSQKKQSLPLHLPLRQAWDNHMSVS